MFLQVCEVSDIVCKAALNSDRFDLETISICRSAEYFCVHKLASNLCTNLLLWLKRRFEAKKMFFLMNWGYYANFYPSMWRIIQNSFYWRPILKENHLLFDAFQLQMHRKLGVVFTAHQPRFSRGQIDAGIVRCVSVLQYMQMFQFCVP